MLSIIDLTFSFNEQGPVFFDRVSASFVSGRIHFIRGKNGSGKSTFFRILKHDMLTGERVSGELILNGHTYALRAGAYEHLVGMVHQKVDAMLVDEASCIENLQLALLSTYPTVAPLPAPPEIPAFVSRFGIDPHIPVKRLSGGQRQIVAILMALQKKISVLLLDEPTAALDEVNAAMVISFLEQLAQQLQLVVLIISHDKELVEQYACDGHVEIIVDPHTHARTIARVG